MNFFILSIRHDNCVTIFYSDSFLCAVFFEKNKNCKETFLNLFVGSTNLTLIKQLSCDTRETFSSNVVDNILQAVAKVGHRLWREALWWMVPWLLKGEGE